MNKNIDIISLSLGLFFGLQLQSSDILPQKNAQNSSDKLAAQESLSYNNRNTMQLSFSIPSQIKLEPTLLQGTVEVDLPENKDLHEPYVQGFGEGFKTSLNIMQSHALVIPQAEVSMFNDRIYYKGLGIGVLITTACIAAACVVLSRS